MRRLVDAMMATKVVTTSIKRKFLPAVPHRSGEIMTMMMMMTMIITRSGGSSGPPSRVVSVTSSQVRASLRSQEAAVYTTQLSTTSNTSTLSGNSNNNTSSNRSGNRRTVPRLETQDSFDSWSIPVLSKEEASRILSSKRPRVRIDTFFSRNLRIIFVYLPVLAAEEAS